MIMVGVTLEGERLQFEHWLYMAFLRGQVTDKFLLSQLYRVVQWREYGIVQAPC